MMNVSIIGRKVTITPDVRKHIEKDMKKLDYFSNHIYDFKLILKRERHIYFAEVNINVKRKIIHIFAKTEDVHSVIDMLFDKIEVKIGRYRDKLINRRVISLKESIMNAEEPDPGVEEIEETA
ncbi:MAG: ribosome-associated translation inhibitor RaiA [Spirochaetes bacterium]|nr:ribosome-associated translation inhibitor RaiA [Spirochaetota bacterium]